MSMACLLRERVFKSVTDKSLFEDNNFLSGTKIRSFRKYSYYLAASVLVFIEEREYFPIKYKPSMFVTRLKATYICPGLNAF